jgi:hypothetical protein
MRWLKHLSTARNDEKLIEFRELYGLEGYGFWWMLCEIVAEQMNGSEKCKVSLPVKSWLRISGVYHYKKFKDMVVHLNNISLISAQSFDNVSSISDLSVKDVLIISIPNLLKYRDEYSQKIGTKSGQNPD